MYIMLMLLLYSRNCHKGRYG